MPLSLTQTRLVRIVAGQAITNNLLNLLALSPSVSISGSVATADLAAGAVTAAKATPDAYFYAADTTNTNTYTGAYNPAVGAYANGLQLFLKVTNANTLAAVPSLDANSLGAKNIYHRGGLTPKPGDIVANSILHLVYNSSLNTGTGGFEIYGMTPSASIRPAGTTAGSATVQTVVNTPVLTGYAAGILIFATVGSALTNTGALTLNCDGLGARNVLLPGNPSALPIGFWQAGQTYLLYDDGTQFIVLSHEAKPCIVAACRNLVVQSNAAAPTTQVDVSADEVILKYCGAIASPNLTNGAPLLVSTVTLTVDITGGVALNAFETGASRTTSRWYYLWLISNGTTVKAVLEDSGSADGAVPAGPDLSGGAFAGYVYCGLVGQIRLNATGSGEVVGMVQFDREVFMLEQVILSAKVPAGNDTYEILAGADLTALRAAVPPTGKCCGGFFGSDNLTDNTNAALAPTKADGTLASVIIGSVYHVQPNNNTATYNGYGNASQFSRLPVRGAASRNIQWKSRTTALTVSLSLTSYTF